MSEVNEKHKRQLEINGLLACLDTLEGRSFLRWMFTRCGYRQPVFAANALAMARNAGIQEPGLDLEAFIEQVSPAGLARVLLEDYTDVRSSNDGSSQSEPYDPWANPRDPADGAADN